MDNIEREIDLIDLLESICKKWRTIIVYTIIGLVIGGAISTAMALYYKKNASLEMKKASVEKTLAEAEKKLSEDENGDELKRVADGNIHNYMIKQEMYDMQEKYMENSIYSSIDAENVNKVILSYYIDNQYTATYPVIANYNNIEDIVHFYMTSIKSNDVYDRIISEVYPESQYEYIDELIKVSSEAVGNVDIVIVADSKDNADRIANILKDSMEEITTEVDVKYCETDCKLQVEQYIQGSDTEIADERALQAKKLIDYNKEMQTIKNSMSGAQLDYFKSKLGLQELEKSEEESKPLFFYLSKKLIVIVAVLGAFIAVCIYGCAYIFSGSIKTKEDIQLIVKKTNIGSIEEDVIYNNPIDKLIFNIFNGNKSLIGIDNKVDIISNIIVETMKTHNLNKLCIVSSEGVQAENAMTKLVKAISDKGVVVEVADKFLENAQGMQIANNSDAVVVVEKIKKSQFSNVEQEVRLLGMNDVNILGCVSA